MRNPSDKLFRLIRSMTMSEKIYFKRLSSVHSLGDTNKYLRLFDAIEFQTGQGKYDENKVRKNFEDSDKFLNNLHVAKKYLYDSILKSLRIFHSESLPSAQISNHIIGAIILARKLLLEESMAELTRAKKLSVDNRLHEFFFIILKVERYLLAPHMFKVLSNNIKEMKEAEKMMSNIVSYSKLIERFFRIRREIILRKEDRSKELKDLLKDPLLSHQDKALTPESEVLLNKFYFNYYLYSSDDKKTYLYTKKILKILEGDPNHKKEFLQEYVSVLKSLLDSILFLKKYDEAEEIIEKLENIERTSYYMEENIFFVIAGYRTTKAIQTGDPKGGLSVIREAEKQFKRAGSDMGYLEDQFNYSTAYLYIMAEKYDKALQCLNKVLNKKPSAVRPDLMNFAHLLNLITHLELNNIELLRYSVRNTFRFLEKRQRLYKTENEVLEFLKRSPSMITNGKLKENLLKLKDNLYEITKDPYEKISLDYFDLISWVESKIQGKPFASVIKRKAKTK